LRSLLSADAQFLAHEIVSGITISGTSVAVGEQKRVRSLRRWNCSPPALKAADRLWPAFDEPRARQRMT
jgi:hypothetical protein